LANCAVVSAARFSLWTDRRIALGSGLQDSMRMPVDFFSLPSEVRNKIYEELLVHSNTIILNRTWYLDSTIYASGILHLYLAILLLNKKAHREASSILYSRNCFEIQNSELLTSFLDQIGPQNAGTLRRLVIAFPAFHNDGHAVGITLQEDGVWTLDLIHDKCQNIVTLETSLHTTNAMEIRLDEFDSPRAADQALALVDARLKAIPSLQELLVHVYGEPINLALREKMRDYGWIIKISEQNQREIDELLEDYDYDIDYDYDGYNSYDRYEAERLEREW
jgi:hypothetical protein